MPSQPPSTATPTVRRRVVTPQLSGRNRRAAGERAAALAAYDAGYSGTQTASHFSPVTSGSRTVYRETQIEISAPLRSVPSVSLPPVPGLVNLPKEEYIRPAENHGGVPFVVREPADDDEDDDDDDDDPEPGKVSRSSLMCNGLQYTFPNSFTSSLPCNSGRRFATRSGRNCFATTRVARHTWLMLAAATAGPRTTCAIGAPSACTPTCCARVVSSPGTDTNRSISLRYVMM
jgi:hypothetical protein